METASRYESCDCITTTMCTHGKLRVFQWSQAGETVCVPCPIGTYRWVDDLFGCEECDGDMGLSCPEEGMIRPHVLPGFYMPDGDWTATECFPRKACRGGLSCFPLKPDAEDVFITSPEMTPGDAEAWCIQRAGHLASIHTTAERESIVNFVVRQAVSEYPWIGGADCTSDLSGFKCKWVDGSPWSTAWHTADDTVSGGTAMHVSACQNRTVTDAMIVDAGGLPSPCPATARLQTNWMQWCVETPTVSGDPVRKERYCVQQGICKIQLTKTLSSSGEEDEWLKENRAQLCLSSLCAEGYDGDRCTSCAHTGTNRYYRSNGACEKCPKNTQNFKILLVVMVFVVLILTVVLGSKLAKIKDLGAHGHSQCLSLMCPLSVLRR